MYSLPEDVLISIFKNFTASTLKSAMLVNKTFKNTSQYKITWNAVYENTIPSKFITYNNKNFRELLKQHLSILRHTEWFKRQLFLNFAFECIEYDENSTITLASLIDAFKEYSKGKFDSIPKSWYWESLSGKHQHKTDKLMKIAHSSEYVNYEYNGSYIHWNFPCDKESKLKGFKLQLKEDLTKGV